MVDTGPLRGQGVRYGSTNQVNSTFHPSGTGVDTIKRQTRAAFGSLVVGQSVGAGLAYGL